MNRQELAELFLNGATTIAQKTNHVRALQVANMLTRYVLHAPATHGTSCIDTRDPATVPGPLYRLVPILPEDASIAPMWRESLNGGGAAEAKPDHASILLKCRAPMSGVVCGFLLLHEGGHALSLMERPRNWRDRPIFIQDEIETHTFQYTLQSLFGGPAYATCLEKQVEVFAQEGSLRPDGSFSFRAWTEVATELDQAFGSAASQYEYNLRTTFLWNHACMEYLTRKVTPSNVPNAHRALFESYYKDLIPDSL